MAIEFGEVVSRYVGREGNAQDGVLRFQVSFPGNERFGATRQEVIGIRGRGNQKGDPEKLTKAVKQFRQCLRFVMIESGQSLEDVLAGRFREILHTVIREHLRKQHSAAEGQRDKYIAGLQAELLEPLRDRIEAIVSSVIPEIAGVVLEPAVPDVDTTLSNVGITLKDAVDTSLGNKGTGVRGAVMVAMLRYLADQTKRSMVFAVEEPEAFLHPSAQEELRGDLESLAERRDVTLIVSTHSPFVLSRDPKARIFSIVKDAEGRTRVATIGKGDGPHSGLLGGLFRDVIVAEILDRASSIPTAARGVVLVEGFTDVLYLTQAATASGRLELVEDLHFVSTDGAPKLVLEATVTRAQTALPVVALLDSDETGRAAVKMLTEKLGFDRAAEVMTYSEIFKGNPSGVEAEDLLPNPLMEAFIKAVGESAVLSEKKRLPGLKRWHYGLNTSGKALIGKVVQRHAKSSDFAEFIEVLETLRERLFEREDQSG